MKSKISTGIWLVFFGLIALLDNFNIIDFNFYAITRYWPLLIVSLGINLIFQYKNYGTAVIIGVNMALCVFLAFVGFTSKEKFNWMGKVVYNSTKLDTTNAKSVVHVPFSDAFNNPEFVFNIGAATVKVDSNTTHLMEAKSDNKNLSFQLETQKNDIELNAVIRDKNAKDHLVFLALNTTPTWDLTFNIGAARFDADFSTHKFSRLEINSGAAAVNFKLGQPTVEETEIEINTAASSCKITLPKDAACAIEMTTIFSSNKLEGFTKKDGIWQTDNYEAAAKKYVINLNGAANSLKIDRY
jgi:hypothetical protein